MPADNGAPENYRTLGRKTFVIFLMGKTRPASIIFVIAIVLATLGGSGAFTNISGQNFDPYINSAAIAALVLFVVAFALAFLIAWLEYSTYKFFMDEDALRIKRGVLSKEEIAIPYRQIQNVDIERSFSYQLLGLSRLVILTAGHDDDKTLGGESEGVLPALDENLAKQLQEELLKRAGVERVVETK